MNFRLTTVAVLGSVRPQVFPHTVLPQGEFLTDVHQQHLGVDEDARLLEHHFAGCGDCFCLFFRRHWKTVFTIAMGTLGKKADAEDIVQEFFLAVYLGKLHYDSSRGSVRTWVSRFAQYKSLEARRRRAGTASRYVDDSVEPEAEPRSNEIGTSSEQHTLIEQCLSSLPLLQRRAIEVIQFQGCTFAEAAIQLNESLANTRNLYYRGMDAMRRFVKQPGTVRADRAAGCGKRRTPDGDPALALEAGS